MKSKGLWNGLLIGLLVGVVIGLFVGWTQTERFAKGQAIRRVLEQVEVASRLQQGESNALLTEIEAGFVTEAHRLTRLSEDRRAALALSEIERYYQQAGKPIPEEIVAALNR